MSAIVMAGVGGRRKNRGGNRGSSSVVVVRPSTQVVSRPRNSQNMNNRQVVVQVPNNPPRSRNRRNRGNNQGRMMSIPRSVGAAYDSIVQGGAPLYKSGSRPGSLVVSHHESMGELLGTTAFSATYYMLIPALFAWLSGVAKNFSRYKWNRLSISWVTSSPTSQSGTVAMGVLYDYNDTSVAMTGIEEVLALAHSFMCPVWSPPNGVLGTSTLDSTRWSRPWYVNHMPTTPSQYDEFVPAWLTVGKQTQVNGQPIGHLVASYEVEFSDPIPARINDPTSVMLTSGAQAPKRAAFTSVEERMAVVLEKMSAVILADPKKDEEEVKKESEGGGVENTLPSPSGA